jgi:hypothetical protein
LGYSASWCFIARSVCHSLVAWVIRARPSTRIQRPSQATPGEVAVAEDLHAALVIGGLEQVGGGVGADEQLLGQRLARPPTQNE